MTSGQIGVAACLAAIAVFTAVFPLAKRARRPSRQDLGVVASVALLAAVGVAFLGDGFGSYVESMTAAFVATAALAFFAKTRQESQPTTFVRLTAVVVMVNGAVLALRM